MLSLLPTLVLFFTTSELFLNIYICPLFHRVATPSASYWRLPRRRCQRMTGEEPRWSWRPQQVCACCLKTRPGIFWGRWGTFSLCPQTVWHKHQLSRQRSGDEKPLSAYKCHRKKKRQHVCPFGGYHVAKNSCCGVVWSNHICHFKYYPGYCFSHACGLVICHSKAERTVCLLEAG